jgi:hypothetical protein
LRDCRKGLKIKGWDSKDGFIGGGRSFSENGERVDVVRGDVKLFVTGGRGNSPRGETVAIFHALSSCSLFSNLKQTSMMLIYQEIHLRNLFQDFAS